jgi:hypothetical protein
MPTKPTKTETPNTTRKLNPTIAPAYQNDKFGYGSFLSKPIDEKGFNEIQRNLVIGSRVLLKNTRKQSANGSTIYFLEILPPYEGPSKQPARVGNTESEI